MPRAPVDSNTSILVNQNTSTFACYKGSKTMPTRKFVPAKVTEEAKICAEIIKLRMKPDHEIQQIISACVIDWLKREAPHLMDDVASALQSRQVARRDAKARQQLKAPPESRPE